MISPKRRQVLLNDLRSTILLWFPTYDPGWIDLLAERLVKTIELSQVVRDYNRQSPGTPDIDCDANPLDDDLPPADDGRWLDESPCAPNEPPSDGEPSAS